MSASTVDNLLTISVADDGRGMDPEFARRVRDPFVTTRTVRKVGLGIPMLAVGAEMCGGGVTIESAPGRGTTIEARFELNHVDRPPLGDMVSTLVTLIVANPSISFRYEHRFDEHEFVLDTTEICERLEDVPITDPGVVAWIRGFCAEGISAAGEIN